MKNIELESYTVVALTLSTDSKICGYTFEPIERKPEEMIKLLGKVSVKFQDGCIVANATVRPYNVKGVSADLREAVIAFLGQMHFNFINNLMWI
jgi:hypothetical protein